MKRIKKQSGITIVALIITIIVLLILAVVAIRAVTGDSIIAHAKNARDKYAESSENESITFERYQDELEKNTTGDWVQNKTEIKNNKTGKIVKVGQTTTNYKAGDYVWKVLGVENGKLLLMTSVNVVENLELTGDTGGWNAQENRFVVAEKTLDDECKRAVTNLEGAINIRSAKVEDINRVTGYNPVNYNIGETSQYGNEVIYTLKDGKVAYSSPSRNGVSSYTRYKHIDGRELGVDGIESITVKSGYYRYEANEISNMTENDEAYKLLFNNSGNSYWLASSYLYAAEGSTAFSLYHVEDGVLGEGLYGTVSGSFGKSRGIRAVVVMPNNFQF